MLQSTKVIISCGPTTNFTLKLQSYPPFNSGPLRKFFLKVNFGNVLLKPKAKIIGLKKEKFGIKIINVKLIA